MTRRQRTLNRMTIALTLIAGSGTAAAAQSLPFGPGELLVYRVRVAPMGNVGEGTLSVHGPELVRGRETYQLSFAFSASFGPLKGMQQSDSWLDPERLAALRFQRRERKPLARESGELVEIYPDEARWEEAGGETGRAPTTAPLDELSLLYYVRLMPLHEGLEVRLDRHFDVDRNPVWVKALRRETIDVPAGTFRAMLVEMRVRDPARYRGEGRIRMHIVEDGRRLPVRIQTALPDAGTITLDLAAVPGTVMPVSVAPRR